MAFSVHISEGNRFIVGKIEEELTAEIAQDLAREYVKIIEATGIRRILNDVRGIKSKMNIIDDYNFAYNDAHQIGLPRSIRAAILTDTDPYH